MLVELRARKRRRPRRAIILHRWVTHEWVNIDPDDVTLVEAVTFVEMRWPRGPDAWVLLTCRVCNREHLWDMTMQEKAPSCPSCANEIDEDFE